MHTSPLNPIKSGTQPLVDDQKGPKGGGDGSIFKFAKIEPGKNAPIRPINLKRMKGHSESMKPIHN